jgi:hypothetical protein
VNTYSKFIRRVSSGVALVGGVSFTLQTFLVKAGGWSFFLLQAFVHDVL